MNIAIKVHCFLLAIFISFGVIFNANAEAGKAQITVLYDAFGKPSNLRKDWGFSAYIEFGGKRVLFDTGNNAEVFAHNVTATGIDLTRLDFAIVSHRHGDHAAGITHLVDVNPELPIYVPKENFSLFGAALPGKFLKPNAALPAEMRYFDGKVPERLTFGSAWPNGNFQWVTENMEIAPGFHLILLKGPWGVDLDVMEISLAIDTPNGTVLVVGCSHPTLEKIIEAAAAEITGKPIQLVLGGMHLLPASEGEINRIAIKLRDQLNVGYIAPVHCTGETAFEILQKAFADRYIYAGLGSSVQLGEEIVALDINGKTYTKSKLTAEEAKTYQEMAITSHDFQGNLLAVNQ